MSKDTFKKLWLDRDINCIIFSGFVPNLQYTSFLGSKHARILV